MSEPLNASIDTRKKGKRFAIVPKFWDKPTIQSAQVDYCAKKILLASYRHRSYNQRTWKRKKIWTSRKANDKSRQPLGHGPSVRIPLCQTYKTELVQPE